MSSTGPVSCPYVSPLWPSDAEHQQHRHVPTGHAAEGRPARGEGRPQAAV